MADPNVVILAPHRSDRGHRRDQIWRYVKDWYTTQFPDWPVYWADSIGETFSIGQARNRVASGCGDWDVAVMIDSDTIADPMGIHEAVQRAHNHNQMIMAGDVHMRMNERTSNRIMFEDVWFPRPDGYLPKNGVNEYIYGEPSSGCFAIGRELWDATSGFVESLSGWGFDDLIFMTQCHVVGDGVAWVPDSTLLHFWHPRAEVTEDTDRNRLIYNAFHALSEIDHGMAKEFLRTLGHPW